MKFVCSVCGYVHEGDAAPEKCPVCNAPAEKFTAQGDENTAVPPGFPIGALMTSVTGGPAAPYACSGTRLRDDLPRLRGTPCTRRRLSGTPWEACTPSLLCLLHGL